MQSESYAESVPIPACVSTIPTFSSSSVRLLGPIFCSLLHLELSFLKDERWRFTSIPLHVDIQVSQLHLLKMFSACLFFASEGGAVWISLYLYLGLLFLFNDLCVCLVA